MIGIETPIKGHPLEAGNRCYNQLHRALQVPTERTNAIVKWYRARRHLTLDPGRNADIAAALVIAIMTRGRW